jgi:tartrate dehydratase alpha subunit/fumarate hydratase class I-like protein
MGAGDPGLRRDIKAGFYTASTTSSERDRRHREAILATMIENIGVAERMDNLLCQDTGIPIFNVLVGRNVQVDGWALKQAIARGTARATREHPLRSSVVHPITRRNEHTSCGARAGHQHRLHRPTASCGSR